MTIRIPSLIPLLMLAACGMTEDEKKLLIETRTIAQEAKAAAWKAHQQSNQALQQSGHAADMSEESAKAAKIASEKADRIFREAQYK